MSASAFCRVLQPHQTAICNAAHPVEALSTLSLYTKIAADHREWDRRKSLHGWIKIGKQKVLPPYFC